MYFPSNINYPTLLKSKVLQCNSFWAYVLFSGSVSSEMSYRIIYHSLVPKEG